MNNLDENYKNLLFKIASEGYNKSDRTGTGTISFFGCEIRHNMKEGFPLLTTKKMYWKGIVTELLWFLRGETNIQSLVKDGNNIWVGDAYKKYYNEVKDLNIKDFGSNGDAPTPKEEIIVNCNIDGEIDNDGEFRPYIKKEFIEKVKNDDEFAKKWGDLGPIYGKQWRSWEHSKNDEQPPEYNNIVEYIDQIKNIIETLKNNPDSRRIMVNAWNVGEVDKAVLPPCHYGFQLYTRELSQGERQEEFYKKYPNKRLDDFAPKGMEVQDMKEQVKTRLDNANIPKRAISLMWNQRSVDTPLGLPFNIASYGLLLEIIAKHVNMIAEELIGSLGDTHIYNNQLEGFKEQIKRGSYKLPNLKISDREVNDISEYTKEDFELINYKSHDKIDFPLSN